MSLRAAIAWLVVVLAVYALIVALGWRHGGKGGLIAAVCAAPFAGVAITPALMALLPAYIDWVTARIWQRWQGRYYAFDDRQIRIVEARGCLWFSSKDVHAVLGMSERPALLAQFGAAERRRDDEIGDALSHAGLVRLLARRSDARTQRFMLWAERDVCKPWANKRERAAVDAVMAQNPRS